MRERAFEYTFDGGTSTLELYGVIDHTTLPGVREAVDRAYRMTPCRLTVDLTGMDLMPAHHLGWLVHLCNSRYPGTLIRPPERRQTLPATGAHVMPASA